jgi:DNA topoisomerase I
VIELWDRKLATIVKRCRDIPGTRLFQYLSDRGQRRFVAACDLNRYLREATGDPFTAKEFRAWHGTLHASLHLAQCERHAPSGLSAEEWRY